MRRTHASIAVLASIGIAVLVGCGAPTDRSRTIADDSVPYALLSPSPTTDPIPSSPPAGAAPTAVYFLDADDLLVEVPFPLSGATDDIVAGLLDRLQRGPDDQSRGEGLGSALGPDVDLTLANIVGTTAFIEVSVPTQGPTADRLPLAAGQIVLTVTSVTAIEQVVFLTGGDPVDITLPGGQRTAGPGWSRSVRGSPRHGPTRQQRIAGLARDRAREGEPRVARSKVSSSSPHHADGTR